MNEMQNDKKDENLIKLQALQKEYDVTLQQYEESVNNYIISLQNKTTSSTNTASFAALKGRTWWGTQGVSEGIVDSQEQCESMCASNSNCTGATFNPVKRYCWARGGEGTITPGLDDDYALIPQQKAALITMKSLNDKLLSINKEILAIVQQMQPQMEAQKEEKNNKYTMLNNSYQQLLEQKLAMERQLQEYNSIEEDYENQDLYATQQNVAYRTWSTIALIMIVITIKKMIGSDSAPVNIIFWAVLFVLLFSLTFNLGQPAGFLAWFLLLMIIILMRVGFLPSL
jgi:hypothetical protein